MTCLLGPEFSENYIFPWPLLVSSLLPHCLDWSWEWVKQGPEYWKCSMLQHSLWKYFLRCSEKEWIIGRNKIDTGRWFMPWCDTGERWGAELGVWIMKIPRQSSQPGLVGEERERTPHHPHGSLSFLPQGGRGRVEAWGTEELHSGQGGLGAPCSLHTQLSRTVAQVWLWGRLWVVVVPKFHICCCDKTSWQKAA